MEDFRDTTLDHLFESMEEKHFESVEDSHFVLESDKSLVSALIQNMC